MASGCDECAIKYKMKEAIRCNNLDPFPHRISDRRSSALSGTVQVISVTPL